MVIFRKPYLGIAVAGILFCQASQSFAEQCAEGQAANEQSDWEIIENNAFRTADDYVVRHDRPEATPTFGVAKVYYQYGGEFEGRYLVQILHEGSGVTLMMLRPTFDFCSNINNLDDSREDLFEVVVAKYNGIKF